MKVINPILRKVLLEFYDLENPLEFWWDEEMLNHFKTLLNNDRESMIRAPNTPDSIVEFKLKSLKKINITDISELILKGKCIHLTNFYKHFRSLHLPIPNSTFNDEFEFPITLICLLNKETNSLSKLDISNYVNLDYLKNRDLSIDEVFKDINDFNFENTKSPNILFAEFLCLP